MRFRFTKYAKQKFLRLKKIGFTITQKQVKHAVLSPLQIEDRQDGTSIVMILFDQTHVLRVVYRIEDGIIVIITFYPGRRKAYNI